MKLYLAGPMRGYPDFNYPAFDNAAFMLRMRGYEVFNPADHDRSMGHDLKSPTGSHDDAIAQGFSIRKALKADLSWICDHADGIAYLEGAKTSKGAITEMALGNALGIPVRPFGSWIVQASPLVVVNA